MKVLVHIALLTLSVPLSYSQSPSSAEPGRIDAAHERKGWQLSQIDAAPLRFKLSSPSEPVVVVDNLALTHEHKGWRVLEVSNTPIHLNVMKGDLIVRIAGRNAAETGPMQMTSLLNEANREMVHLFIERGDLRMEIKLRDISNVNFAPVNADPFKHVATGFSAPDEAFKDIDGHPITLDRFKDKWLLIDFMGTWCPPCMEGLPELLSIADGNRLSVLLVTLNDKPEAVRRMQQQYRVQATIDMAQPMSKLPIDFGIATDHWTSQIPGLVLLRPDGEVALVELGGREKGQLAKIIECLMTGKTDLPEE